MCKNKIEVGSILRCSKPFSFCAQSLRTGMREPITIFIGTIWKVYKYYNEEVELTALSECYKGRINSIWIGIDNIDSNFHNIDNKQDGVQDNFSNKQIYASIAVEWVEKYNKYKKKDEKIDTSLIINTLIQADIQTIKYFTGEIVQLIAFEKSNRLDPMERGYTDTANAINIIKNKERKQGV